MPEIDFHGVGYSIYAPGTSFGPYTVLPYELVWIDEGDASLTANGQTYELSPNTVILSRPGDRNTYHWDPEHTTRHGYLYFSTATADPPAPQLRHLAGDDVILSLLRHVRWLDAERPDQWQDLAGQALRYAVRAFSTGASRTSGPSDQRIPAVIQRSLALIRQQWAPGGPLHTPTLSELADAAAVTPEYLCRIYKKDLGYSPMAALRLLRLNRTAALLARSNMTVKQVARQGGFGNQFHFSRTFKQAFGVSPSEFRRTRQIGTELPPTIRRLDTYM